MPALPRSPFDTVQIGMDQAASAFFILNDLWRLVPTAFRRPPQRGKRRSSSGSARCCAERLAFEIGHAHPHLGA